LKVAGRTLGNRRMPLTLKNMLVCNMLVPTITYGMVVFGGRRDRLNGIKKALSTAFAAILRKGKCSNSRVCQEFGLMQTKGLPRYRITLSIKKWEESHATIGDLIRAESTVLGGRTEISKAKAWSQRHRLTTCRSEKETSGSLRRLQECEATRSENARAAEAYGRKRHGPV